MPIFQLFVIFAVTYALRCNVSDNTTSSVPAEVDLFPGSMWSKTLDIRPFTADVYDYGISICAGRNNDFYLYGSDASNSTAKGIWINHYDDSGSTLFKKRFFNDSGYASIEMAHANPDGTLSLLVNNPTPLIESSLLRLDGNGTPIDSATISEVFAYTPLVCFADNGDFVELWSYSNSQCKLTARSIDGNITGFIRFMLPPNSYLSVFTHGYDSSFLIGISTSVDTGIINRAVKIAWHGGIIWSTELPENEHQSIYWASRGNGIFDLFFTYVGGNHVLFALDSTGQIIFADTTDFFHPVKTLTGNLLLFQEWPSIASKYSLLDGWPYLSLNQSYSVNANRHFYLRDAIELLSGAVITIVEDQNGKYYLVCFPGS